MKKTLFNNAKVWTLASLILLGGAVVGCSDDYDDDIHANEVAISALGDQLNALQGAFEQAKKDAQDAHANYVTQTQLGNTEAAAKEAAKEAAATAKAEAIAEAIEQCKALVSGKADQSALDALSTRIDALDASLNKLGSLATTDALEAAKKNLQDQINALDYLKELLPEGSDFATQLSQLNSLKAELTEALQKIDGMNLDELKTTMNSLSEKVNKIDGIGNQVNLLTVLVNKVLTSVTLIPQLYIDGIEAFEFRVLEYQPIDPKTSGSSVLNKKVRIASDETKIQYRLNPNTVKLESIDKDNISFVAHTAKSRTATESPVLYSSIDDNYHDGILTVNAKRNPNVSLATSNGDIWVAAVKIPRKADAETGAEYAEIYSEYSMVTETTFAPQITQVAVTNEQFGQYRNGSAKTLPEQMVAPTYNKWSNTEYHFSDSAAVYQSYVDQDQLVYAKLMFNKEFDLAQLVTGCYERDYANRPDSKHISIKRDELKKYGLAFRFHIADAKYTTDVQNQTNQQEFAAIKNNSILYSKTPAGITDNKAVIGKEPIIRIMLCDTVNNYTLDQRYIKIKWDEEIELEKPALDPKHIDDLTSEITLDPCGDVTVEGYTWREFVNKVYAVIGTQGVSQEKFDKIYPAADRTIIGGTWKGYVDNNIQATSGEVQGTYNGNLPAIVTTTNIHGDALVCTWNLNSADIKRVIFSNDDPAKAIHNYKLIPARITFKSNDPEYPDIWFDWTVKVKAPQKFPALEGYYDQYWYQKYDIVDVFPVQYKTNAQTEGNFYSTFSVPNNTPAMGYQMSNFLNPGYDKCVYDFNLTNAFVYNTNGGIISYIVKNLTACGSYDIQFRKNQSVNGYTSSAIANSLSNTNDPAPESLIWNDFSGYKLKKNGSNNALQMYWIEVQDGNAKVMSTPVQYTSWNPMPNWRAAKIFADSSCKNGLSSIINKLGDDVRQADGSYVPARTHNNKVDMGVWTRLNEWNYLLVKDYDLCLIDALRINIKSNGALEDGVIGGCKPVSLADVYTMSDFRGYLVAQQGADIPRVTAGYNYNNEQKKYYSELFDYYQVVPKTFTNEELDAMVTYGLEVVGGSIVVNNNLPKNQRMTRAQLTRLTNGNVNISVQHPLDSSGREILDQLTFLNNGGSNIEEMCYAYIPVQIDYCFGTLVDYIAIPIYPHGYVPQN